MYHINLVCGDLLCLEIFKMSVPALLLFSLKFHSFYSFKGQSLCEFRQEIVNTSTACAVVNVTISLDYTYTNINKTEKV